MPYYYDVSRVETTNASAGTESTHMWVTTVANQETVGIVQMLASARGGTAGGASIRVKHNTGAIATGGTAQTPAARNLRGAPAAQSVWKNDATAITAGATLVQRLAFGMAQTGGTGGWVATEPTAKIQMMPNATNPVDVEVTSLANGTSVAFDLTIEFGEGI